MKGSDHGDRGELSFEAEAGPRVDSQTVKSAFGTTVSFTTRSAVRTMMNCEEESRY